MVDSPVLISGEAGTGKEKLARFIHNHSKRAAFSFMRINFSVVPKDEPLSYLFGCEDSENGEYHMGVLESADGGTVYVDEITEIPQIVRGRFLALLRRDACVMGDGMQRKLNIRWIVSSKYSLEELREKKLIEEDILSCLSLFPMEILPLRERRTDIIPLLDYFLRRYNQKTGEKKYFSRPCYDKLMRYEWPGNVREVSNLVQRAAIISAGDKITESDLTLEETRTVNVRGDAAAVQNAFALKDGPVDLKSEVARLEAAYMTDAFLKFQNIRDAAKSLGMDSSTFVRKRQRYEKMGFMGKERKK